MRRKVGQGVMASQDIRNMLTHGAHARAATGGTPRGRTQHLGAEGQQWLGTSNMDNLFLKT